MPCSLDLVRCGMKASLAVLVSGRCCVCSAPLLALCTYLKSALVFGLVVIFGRSFVSGYFRLATAKKNLNELDAAADVIKVGLLVYIVVEPPVKTRRGGGGGLAGVPRRPATEAAALYRRRGETNVRTKTRGRKVVHFIGFFFACAACARYDTPRFVLRRIYACLFHIL